MRVTIDNVRGVEPYISELADIADDTAEHLRTFSTLAVNTLKAMGWTLDTDEDTESFYDDLDKLAWLIDDLNTSTKKWREMQEYYAKWGGARDGYTLAYHRERIDTLLPQMERHLRKFLEGVGYYPDK
jgi:DNA-binding ferritin-like protein